MLAARAGGALRFYDERDYHAVATHLLAGAGFSGDHGPTAFRAPGQPAFLAAVYAIAGERPIAALVVESTLLVALPFLVAALARRLGAPAWAAGLAAAAASMHPGLAVASATLYPAALTAVALTAGIVLAADALDSGSLPRAAASGLALGVAGAATTTFAPVALLVGLVAALRKRLAMAAIVIAVGLAPTAAWAARNAVTLGAPTLATHGGFNLALGANDRATPRSGNHVDLPIPRAELPDDELARDRALRDAGVRWIEAHPGRWAGLAAARAVAAVVDSVGNPATESARPGLGAKLVGATVSLAVLLGLAGLALRRRDPAAWIAGAALALVVATSALSIAKPRFRLPCDPALFAFGAVALGEAARARARRRARGADDVAPSEAVAGARS